MVMSKKEIESNLNRISGWEYDEKTDYITKSYKLKNFNEALDFVNKVGEKAEEDFHHPDILMHQFNKVKLSIRTHREDGITDEDFKLAEKIEKIEM